MIDRVFSSAPALSLCLNTKAIKYLVQFPLTALMIINVPFIMDKATDKIIGSPITIDVGVIKKTSKAN